MTTGSNTQDPPANEGGKNWKLIIGIVLMVLIASLAGYGYFTRDKTDEPPELIVEEAEQTWIFASGLPVADLYIPETTCRIEGRDENVEFSLSVWEKAFEEIDPDNPSTVIDPDPKSRLRSFEMRGTGENLAASASQINIPFKNLDLAGESKTHRFTLKVRLREFRETENSMRGYTERLQRRVQQRYGQEWFPKTEKRLGNLEKNLNGLRSEVADVRNDVSDVQQDMTDGFERVNASLAEIADTVNNPRTSTPPD